MNRVRLIFALGAFAALAGLLVACGGGSSDKSGESAQAVLEEATLQGIESGKLDLTVGLSAPGAKGGKIDAGLSGAFAGEGRGSLPQLDMTATAKGTYKGEPVDFDGGVVLLPNSAYVQYEGVEYEVDPTTFAFVESTLKQAQREAGAETGAAGVAGCQEELGGVKVADLLEDGRNEGAADVGGAGATKVSGTLNVSGAIDTLLEVAESPACRNQLAAAGPLPSPAEVEKAKGEVGSAVRKPQVSVYVGDDDIVRRIVADFTIEPKGGGKGPKRVAVELDLKLTGVNEEQQISAPANAKPLSRLFVKLGINPIELLGLLQGEGGGQSLGRLLEGLATRRGR